MKYNIRWVILAIIIAASFIAYVLRTNVSIVAAEMGRDLDLNEQQLGMIFSAFAAGYAIFQLPGGILSSRYGPRLLIALLALAWGVLTIATAMVPDSDSASVTTILMSMIVIRFLVGATHAPFFPSVAGSAIANWFPQGGWGVPNGLSSTGLTLGAAATAPIIVWLMAETGWRGAILISAPSAFVIAAVWWWYVRDFPNQHQSVTRRELELIDEGREEHGPDDVAGGWKEVVKNRDILLLTASYFCMNYVFYLFFNWFFYYLTEIRQTGSEEASFLNASLWILGAVGATAGGFACDFMIRRMGFRWGPAVLCIIGLTACGICLLAGALIQDTYTAVAFFCMSFGFTQITEAAYWATSIAIGGRLAAAAGGVINTGANVVGFIGGMLVPLIAGSFGWTAAISTGTVFAFVGAGLWLFVRGDRPMAAE